jgi:hypothetical protein
MSSFEAAVEYIRKSYRHDRRLDVSLKPVQHTFHCTSASPAGLEIAGCQWPKAGHILEMAGKNKFELLE